MEPTPGDGDARVSRLCETLPDPLRRAVDGLREPSRVRLRVGAALLAQDVPVLKVPLEKSARWIEATWAELVALWRRQKR